MNDKVKTIYEDDDLVVVWKAVGIAVQTKKLAEEDVESLLRKQMKVKQLFPITRLDQPVEGLVLFAKTKEAAANLTKQLNNHSMKKIFATRICLLK